MEARSWLGEAADYAGGSAPTGRASLLRRLSWTMAD